MADTVQLHRIDISAAGLLAGLHAEAFAGTGEIWSEADFSNLLALPTSVGVIAALTQNGEEKPLGFILFTQVSNENEIITLAVRPGARRRGIGRLLVNAVLSEAAPLLGASVHLEVDEYNLPARRLYEQAGFQPAGRRRNYYRMSDGRFADAIVMRRDFTGKDI